MTIIPVTYHGGNETDRDFESDLWSWLKHQPQDVWLLFVRVMNWDQVDKLVHRMVKDPRCDLAVAYYLFWSSDPAHYVENPKNSHPGDLIRTIATNCERGFYTSTQLFCSPLLVLPAVQSYIKAVELVGNAQVPFQIPEMLVGPIHGRKASVPSHWSKDLWSEIDDVVSNYDCTLPKSEDEFWQGQVAGGNVRVAQLLQRQGKLKNDRGGGSVVDQLQRIYGTSSDYRKAVRSIPQSQPVYMQKKSVFNPNIMQRYFGFALLALSFVLFVVILARWYLQ